MAGNIFIYILGVVSVVCTSNGIKSGNWWLIIIGAIFSILFLLGFAGGKDFVGMAVMIGLIAFNMVPTIKSKLDQNAKIAEYKKSCLQKDGWEWNEKVSADDKCVETSAHKEKVAKQNCSKKNGYYWDNTASGNKCLETASHRIAREKDECSRRDGYVWKDDKCIETEEHKRIVKEREQRLAEEQKRRQAEEDAKKAAEAASPSLGVSEFDKECLASYKSNGHPNGQIKNGELYVRKEFTGSEIISTWYNGKVTKEASSQPISSRNKLEAQYSYNVDDQDNAEWTCYIAIGMDGIHSIAAMAL